MGSSDADVVESAVVPQRDGAGLVDAVVPDPVVGFGVRGRARQCLGHRVVERRRGRPVGERSMWAAVVVFVGEEVDQCSSASVAGWMSWARSHFFIVCWNRSAFAQVVGGGVLLDDVPVAWLLLDQQPGTDARHLPVDGANAAPRRSLGDQHVGSV